MNDPGRNGFVTGLLGSFDGVPVAFAVWSLSYVLDKMPAGRLGTPPNPILAPAC
jgi:hypothetical protein